MTDTQLDLRTALVAIDLQKGIARGSTVPPALEVVANAAKLAAAFRAENLPVVLVNVAFSADGGDRLNQRADAPAPTGALPADFAELMDELAVASDDLRITKRQWNAFFGTELDLQLRRRHVTGIVLAGISTSIGVESTARAGFELGYNFTFASDAMADRTDVSHRHSLEAIFPRIGQVRTTAQVLEALARRRGAS
jgi:nicotinamidase-related amidase